MTFKEHLTILKPLRALWSAVCLTLSDMDPDTLNTFFGQSVKQAREILDKLILKVLPDEVHCAQAIGDERLAHNEKLRESNFFNEVWQTFQVKNFAFSQVPDKKKWKDIHVPLIYVEDSNHEKQKVPFLEDKIFEQKSHSEQITQVLCPSSRKMFGQDKTVPARFVFFVHGFEGKALDCIKIKHFFSTFRRDAIFHALIQNEGKDTIKNIPEAGKKLAEEVTNIVEEFLNRDFEVESISFVGFSLGGILVRAALPFMASFRPIFKTLITISTPHLGASNSSTMDLLNLGKALFFSFSTNQTVKQIALKDFDKSQEESYLYRLSQEEGLSWFKDVILVSSPLDRYTPYYSSRMSPCKENDPSSVIERMRLNIMSRLKKPVKRLDILNDTEKSDFTGRYQHIRLLHEPLLLFKLSCCCGPYL